MIEKFNAGEENKKYFVPKKDSGFNNTAPINLNKKKVIKPNSESFLKNMNMLKNPNQTQKYIAKKVGDKLKGHSQSKDDGKLNPEEDTNADPHSTSQKDVIVRRIKKKNENSKASSHASIGFGHKKSNSEMLNDNLKKKSSFKDLKTNQRSMQVDPNSSLKRVKVHSRGEFKSQHYKKAMDKFQDFKKEQQMLRKNTPITKFRKGSAKRARVSILYLN